MREGAKDVIPEGSAFDPSIRRRLLERATNTDPGTSSPVIRLSGLSGSQTHHNRSGDCVGHGRRPVPLPDSNRVGRSSGQGHAYAIRPDHHMSTVEEVGYG